MLSYVPITHHPASPVARVGAPTTAAYQLMRRFIELWKFAFIGFAGYCRISQDVDGSVALPVLRL